MIELQTRDIIKDELDKLDNKQFSFICFEFASGKSEDSLRGDKSWNIAVRIHTWHTRDESHRATWHMPEIAFVSSNCHKYLVRLR